MMRSLFSPFWAFSVAALLALGLPSAARAQVEPTPLDAPAVAPPVNYPDIGYAPVYDHASTYTEGAARGMAALVRSAGAAELMNSAAAQNYAQARAAAIRNRLAAVQTYFEAQQLNEQYREEQDGQRPTTEQLFRIAKEQAPEPLSPSELDPYSGEIHWPTILLAPKYADNRRTAELLIAKLFADSYAMTVDDRQALHAALDSIEEHLKTNITAYDPNQYIEAKKFLQRLAATLGLGTL